MGNLSSTIGAAQPGGCCSRYVPLSVKSQYTAAKLARTTRSATQEELTEIRSLIRQTKMETDDDGEHFGLRYYQYMEKQLLSFADVDTFQQELLADPEALALLYEKLGAESGLLASFEEDTLRVNVDEGLDALMMSRMNRLRQASEENKGKVDQVIVQMAVKKYNCWSTLKDTVLPTVDVTLDIIQGVTFWYGGHINWLQILGSAVAFNGAATAIFEGIFSARDSHLLPIDVNIPLSCFGCERSVPLARVVMALLNVCSGGTVGLILESRRCYRQGIKSEEMVMYKVSESVESFVSLIVATYSIECSGLLEGYPSLAGWTLVFRIGSVCSSLVCLPLTGLDVNRHLLFRSRINHPYDEAVKAMKNMFLTNMGKFIILCSHVGEVSSHMIAIAFAFATRPFGIFYFGGGSVAVIWAVGFVIMSPFLVSFWAGMLCLMCRESAITLCHLCAPSKWSCHLFRYFCMGLLIYVPGIVMGLPLLTVAIPLGFALASPLFAIMDISLILSPAIQLLLLSCRTSMWLSAWGILIYKLGNDERLLQKLTNDWHHIFVMAVPLFGLVVYFFAFLIQCYIGRFSGWSDGASAALHGYRGYMENLCKTHPCFACSRLCFSNSLPQRCGNCSTEAPVFLEHDRVRDTRDGRTATVTQKNSEDPNYDIAVYYDQDGGHFWYLANAKDFELIKAWRVNDEGARVAKSGNELFYCSRWLGRQAIPTSDGQCGPESGPQCESCKRFQQQAFEVDHHAGSWTYTHGGTLIDFQTGESIGRIPRGTVVNFVEVKVFRKEGHNYDKCMFGKDEQYGWVYHGAPSDVYKRAKEGDEMKRFDWNAPESLIGKLTGSPPSSAE